MAAPQTQTKTLSPAMSSLLPSDNSHSPASSQSLHPSSFDTATTAGDAATFVTRISSSASTTPLDISPSPSITSLNTTNTTTTSTSACSNNSLTPIESLRRYPLDLTDPIPEEHDEETEETSSESFSNEPATPISGRQSRDFRYCEQNDTYLRRDSVTNGLAASASVVSHEPLNRPFTTQPEYSRSNSDRRPSSTTAPVRFIARRSSSALSKMASIFKRNSYHVGDSSVTTEFREPNYNGETSDSTLASTNRVTPNTSRRRFSYQRSVVSTRSNTPPSPASPSDSLPNSHEKANNASLPTSRDFLENNSKKARASTGLSIRNRVVGFASNKTHSHRRTKSLERKKKNEEELTRQPWAIPPDAGTGMKARRLSLSLPDDFTVDVADLTKEFEYQHKFLGRHGKHLGKGATSKVTLMVRKGSPGELYAVKEFRHKSSSETTEEYEKKIKSEYSIAKSLHHPNIVETVRLCTDHGRWNHVMEYCSEGDLFGLVSKKYLRDESREIDRVCLFKQLCQGINYLHSNGIAHRDIKLENLLITKDSKLKITDFGVSEVFSGIHPGLREAGGQCGVGMGDIRLCKPGICGSLPYIAPEVLSKDVDYDPRALDVWSSAVVMLYLVFNANLWEKAQAGLTSPSQKTYNELNNGWTKINAKKEANPDTIGDDTYPKVTAFEICVKPAPLRRLLLKMLNPDPKKRITMSEVMSNRWMKNVECCQLESYEDPTKFIDASKKDWMKSGANKIFCHNHLPPMSTGHGLPPMPGKPGY
ncbi:kinase-like protein [Daldinia vernicosa]|uniref:kinase-like protein n=1 Tax=Daldinia vernicosa TaxID=114800 RepID=UPI00200871DF|nr:kinase-like protein [Daldinia vernicosa]KAI0848189.1 kinase-like protein [Daldinia vernicosa]